MRLSISVNKSEFRRRTKTCVDGLPWLSVGSAIFLFSILSWIFFGTLLPKPLLINRAGFSQAAYDRNGKLLRISLSSDEKYRLWVPLKDVSPKVIAATLEQEDRYFYYHPGVNPFSLIRGAFSSYVGSRRIGGSTISMQVARIRFGISSKSILGKIKQAAYALWLERKFSKEELLEAYLNLVSYGSNIEGIGSASLVYFGKEPKELTLAEALTLVVIPQSPDARSPYKHSLDDLLSARTKLMERLRHDYKFSQLEEVSLKVSPQIHLRSEIPFEAPHAVSEAFERKPSASRVRTTIDLNIQHQVETQLQSYIAAHKNIGIQNGAIVVADARSNEIRALAGSVDFWNGAIEGQVDGTLGKRSPGSALKPFLYGLAIDEGIIAPQTMLKDTQLTISNYNPENFDRDFVGPLSATEALVRSRNVPALYLAGRVANPSFYDFLKRANISKMRSQDFYGLALTLGGVEVSLQELVSLYAMLANGGEHTPLRLVESTDGTMDNFDQGQRLLSPEASYLTLSMLVENPRPNEGWNSPHILLEGGVPWKTGTSFGFRDAWAVGIAGPYVVGVWIGNFDGAGNPAFVGRDAAGPLLFNVTDALKSQPGFHPEILPTRNVQVKKVKVCSVSGSLPGPHCHVLKDSLYIPGISPIDTCSIHREVQIDLNSGLRACPGQTENIRNEVFEFWPSDILRVFKLAGLPRRLAPPYGTGCSGASYVGITPQITSPQGSVQYAMRVGEQQSIPLSAVSDGDSRKIYWFVDSDLVGTSGSGYPYFWSARPGSYVVRAVDERGRAAASTLKVNLVE